MAEPKQKIVVFSAFSGTGKALATICELLKQSQKVEARIRIDELFIKYRNFITELLENSTHIESAMNVLEEQFGFLNFILKISYSDAVKADILSQGELLSTKIFSIYLAEQNVKHAVLAALDFMALDAKGEPVVGTIKIKLSQILQRTPNTVLLTQGYLVRNVKGETASLGSGGGDYSAALIAGALNAEVCEIWTDTEEVQQFATHVIRDSNAVNIVSFEEAAELAYYGGKLLHPASIWPASAGGIPILLKDINDPAFTKTTITTSSHYSGVSSIAAKDFVINFQIRNNRMFMRHGFLAEVFAVFAKYETSVDMVTTSEIGVAISISEKKYFQEIVTALNQLGTVEVNEFQTMISLVGNVVTRTEQLIKRVFEAMNGIPLSMISFGASPHSISFTVSDIDKQKALERLKLVVFPHAEEEGALDEDTSLGHEAEWNGHAAAIYPINGNHHVADNGTQHKDETVAELASTASMHAQHEGHLAIPKFEDQPINTELRKERIMGDSSINRKEIEKNKIDFEKFFRDHSM